MLQESQERWGLQTKARVLSRKVWELLMLLPTNPATLQGFKSITSGQVSDGSSPAQWPSYMYKISKNVYDWSEELLF